MNWPAFILWIGGGGISAYIAYRIILLAINIITSGVYP